jgi:hypothetical protein
VTDRKDGKLYLYNGVLLTLLFFVSRVALYGAGLLHLATLRRARSVHCAVLLRLHATAFCLLASAAAAIINFVTHPPYSPCVGRQGRVGRPEGQPE